MQIRQLQREFFTVAETAAENARINHQLAKEQGGLKSIVSDQIAASGSFDKSLGSAAENLSPASTPKEAKASIELTMSCNDEMKGHLKKVTSQLERSQDHIDDMQETLMESQKLLLVDPVTEVGNRRFFDTMMNQYFDQPRNANQLGRNRVVAERDLSESRTSNDQ